MKIKITSGTVIHGKGDARPGEVHDLEARVARQLMAAGKAVPYADEPKKPTTRKKPLTTKTAKATIKKTTGKAKK